MMEEPQAWRKLLGKLSSDPQERQRIADAMGVKPITLVRWATNKSSPRPDNLRPLLEALPQYRQQFIELIKQEFPELLPVEVSTEDTTLEIPAAFYARVLSANTSSPPNLRALTICALILQQMVGQFDVPQRGMFAAIAQCVPPPAERRTKQHKIYSLRKIMGRGTLSWRNAAENQTLFLGAESQVGRALRIGSMVAVQNEQERSYLFLSGAEMTEEGMQNTSLVACPILQANRAAGCLYLFSTQPNYFSATQLQLVQAYAELLVLAFERDEFYDMDAIDLGLMPPDHIQQPYLADVQRRITQMLIEAPQNQRPLTRSQAELQVWQQMEEELLRLALTTVDPA